MAAKDPRRNPKPPATPGGVCLAVTGPNSVAITVPQSKLVNSKRGRTEVFDGFSAVFSPDSSQLDIFAQVMNPLVDDFLGGKSGLLVAMGPTGSGKTHTIFGSPRNPGILPLMLRQIFNATNETKVAREPARCIKLIFVRSRLLRIDVGAVAGLSPATVNSAATCILRRSTKLKERFCGRNDTYLKPFMEDDTLLHGLSINDNDEEDCGISIVEDSVHRGMEV